MSRPRTVVAAAGESGRYSGADTPCVNVQRIVTVGLCYLRQCDDAVGFPTSSFLVNALVDDLKGVIPNRGGHAVDVEVEQAAEACSMGWIRPGPIDLI